MSRWKLALLLLLVVGLLALTWLLPAWMWTLSLAEKVRSAGATGVLLFLIAYIVSAVALLPGSLLTMAAGFAYGPLRGVAVASPASVAAATLAFVLGRTLLREWARRKAGGSPQAQAVDHAIAREGFKVVLLLRLSPLVPFNLLNYMLSLTRIDLLPYVLASAIGMLPGTFLYVYLGSLVTTAADLPDATKRGGLWGQMLYVGGLVATVAVVLLVTRTARRALDERVK